MSTKTSNGSHLTKSLRPRMRPLLFVAALCAVAGIFIVLRSFAASAYLAVAPSQGTVGLGSTLSVTVQTGSGTDPINAVQADLTYDPTKLQFNSISPNSSVFPTTAVASGGSGKVSLALGTSGGTSVTGHQTVAVVNFTTIGTGTTAVNFASNAAVVQSSDNTNILVSIVNGAYTIIDTTAPSVPTGLNQPSRTVTSNTISWLASTDNVGVTGYRIYRNGTQVGTSTTTTYTDTGLTPGTSYSYRIAAFDASGNVSAQSAASSFSTLPDTSAPSVPTGLTLSTRTFNSIAFTWNASTDNVSTTGYKIFRNGSQVGTSTSPAFTDIGLNPGTSYSYTVAANDAVGNTSAQSAATSFSTLADTTPPTTPTGLTSPAQTANSISLTWSASTDNIAVTGYKVFRNGTQIATPATTSYTDTGLAGGLTYTYNIAAYDSTGNTSILSSPISVATIVKPGDVNGNGTIDIVDLSILVSNYGLMGATRSQGDLNADSVVNIFDLSILLSNYGK